MAAIKFFACSALTPNRFSQQTGIEVNDLTVTSIALFESTNLTTFSVFLIKFRLFKF